MASSGFYGSQAYEAGRESYGTTFEHWLKHHGGSSFLKRVKADSGEIRDQLRRQFRFGVADSKKAASSNPKRKIPVGKFIPARLNPDGTVTFKVYPKKRAVKKRASAKKRKR